MKTIGTGPKHVLLLHPFLLSGELYYDMVVPYEQDFTFHIPDYRGHGMNIDAEGPYTFEQYTQDIAEVLEGLPVVTALGVSMGGVIAQMLASRFPEKVDRLVLGCTFAHKPQKLSEIMQKHAFASVVQRIGARGLSRLMYSELRKVFQPLRHDVSLLRRLANEARNDVIVENAREIFRVDLREDMTGIKHPTLVIAGGKDWVVPKHHAKQLAMDIPNAELVSLKGAGHFAVFTHRDEFWNTALDWI